MRSWLRALPCLLAIAMTACDDNPLADLPGHYEGSLFQKVTDGAGVSQLVRADITANGKTGGHVEITDLQGNPVQKIDLTGIEKDHFDIVVPGFIEKPARAKTQDGCYLRTGDPGLRFCFSNHAIRFEISVRDRSGVFTLLIDRFHKLAPPAMEKPEELTLSAAIDRALRRNFDSLVEYEHVKQARLTRSYTRKNLYPGVSFGSLVAGVMTLIQGDPTNLIGAAGDLVPFLFLGTRPYQSDDARLAAEAELDTMILLRADTATQVEGFAYVYQRDLDSLRAFEQTLLKANRIRDQIEMREELGQLPPGPSDDIHLVVSNIKQAILALELAVREDKTALAQTLGFHNPEAITNIVFDRPEEFDDNAIDRAPKLNYEELKSLALERSYELRQMDSLIAIAGNQVTERKWTWLDPSGDYQGKLGFGIGDYVAVGKSQLTEMGIKREQLQQMIAMKVRNTLDEYELAIETHIEVARGLEAASNRLGRMMMHFELGTNMDPFGIVQIFQDYLTQQVNEETVEAAFRVACAKIDRFRLTGFYSGLAQFDGAPRPAGRWGGTK